MAGRQYLSPDQTRALYISDELFETHYAYNGAQVFVFVITPRLLIHCLTAPEH
jgi:hypothetical protein